MAHEDEIDPVDDPRYAQFPEPLRRIIAEQVKSHDRMHMQIDMFDHDVERLWQSFDQEQLNGMMTWFTWLGRLSPDQVWREVYSAGKEIYRIGNTKMNLCGACGHDHEKDLLGDAHGEMTEFPDEEQIKKFAEQLGITPDTPASAEDVAALIQKGFDEAGIEAQVIAVPEELFTQEPDAEMYEPEPTREERMAEVGLEKDPDSLSGFRCINCKRLYPTLKDRELAPHGPEGCPGCVHKAKWG